MTFKLTCAAVMLFLLGCVSLSRAADEPQTGQHPQTFDQGGVKLDYLLYLPPAYATDSGKKWPLIIFLHGSGERGTNVNDVKKHGPPKLVEEKSSPLDERFIVVSPQCPPDKHWQPEQLSALLDSIESTYRVDANRIYLTGLSMGGFGTWAWAEAQPERFAAIAPMCGGGNPAHAEALKNLPIWVFHGEQDKAVPFQRSQEMVDAVKKAGNEQVEFTQYPDAGHDCWTRSYANPKLYKWFLSHQRKSQGNGGEKAK